MKRASPSERGTPSAGASGTARLMFYALIAISLMALDYRGHYVERMRSLAERAIEPVFWIVDLPARTFEFAADALRDRAEIEARLDTVEIELEKARARLGVLADLRLENSRLRALLDAARRTRQEFIAAELAGVDLDPFAHRI
ncbi:MAG: rod shape-determining protein MreC, partial [Candidatus Wenzhouxiangella sp. M2_3B_020]